MCYTVLLSTSSAIDLEQYNSELVTFSNDFSASQATEKLSYQHKWQVSSKSGCSCTFRHLHSTELGFGTPVDWFPEEADEISATLQFIKIIRALVANGAEVDCIDSWESSNKKTTLEELNVDLAQISDEEFRFFENYHFIFNCSTGLKR